MTSLALNHDDSYAIESAVRSAIEMVMNAFYRVNSQQLKEYHRNLTKKNIENQKLRNKVEVAERELKTLRRRVRNVEHSFGHSEGGQDNSVHCAPSESASSPHRLHHRVVGDELPGSEHWETEFTALILNQNMAATEAAAADLQDGHIKAPDHQDPLPDHTEAPGGPMSPSPIPVAPLVVKEEPSDAEAVYIKWEMCEQSLGEQNEYLAPVEYSEGECGFREESGSSLQLSEASVAMGNQERDYLISNMRQMPDEMLRNHNQQQRRKQLTQQYSRRLKEKIYADPERLQAYRERERRRYHRRKVLIADLPEESQRLRREAWRAAATRYRARKTTNVLPMDPTEPHLLPQDMETPEQAAEPRRGRPRGGGARHLCS